MQSNDWIIRKYQDFYKRHGYIPKYFEPYNCLEIEGYAPTLTTNSNTSVTHCGTVLIMEQNKTHDV
jgi:hypothetical protein